MNTYRAVDLTQGIAGAEGIAARLHERELPQLDQLFDDCRRVVLVGEAVEMAVALGTTPDT